jgi:L-alanine-DL-glutamate epimerase-like enolase superfamily enzyme
MKISDLKTHVLSTVLDEPFASSMGVVRKRSTMIVELITDEGVTGWGESLCHGLQPPEIAETIVRVALRPIDVWASGIGLAAALQFLATIPPAPLALKPIEPMLEYDQSAHPFRQDLIFQAINMEHGKVQVPTGPGLGVEVNREILERYEKTTA